MEINEILSRLRFMADTYALIPSVCLAAKHTIEEQQKLISALEETAAQQRVRAHTAEDFICKLCTGCEWEDHDGITTMTKKCCSWFPECGKFKLAAAEEMHKVKAERDALIDVLHERCGCESCKHKALDAVIEPCNSCKRTGGTQDNWEWCGLELEVKDED